MVDVPMPEDSDLPSDVVAKLHSLPPISIYRLLAIVPRSLTPWADLVGALYDAELPDRLREIGICRQARTARAPYELFQHRQIAGNVGVTDEELAAIHREPVVTSLDDEANLVCQVADELETGATLSDATQDALYELPVLSRIGDERVGAVGRDRPGGTALRDGGGQRLGLPLATLAPQ